MTAQNEQVWASILSAIPDVETWNRNIPEFKRLTEQYGPECREFIRAEADRRGYVYSKGSRCYALPWTMKACAGKNIIGAGFRANQLAVVFASSDGPRRYESVRRDLDSKDIVKKLVSSPFPDSLYVKLVKNKGIEMERIL